MNTYSLSPSFPTQLDSQDPLAKYRTQFFIPKTKHNKESLYLCGNSLGLQPKKTKLYVEEELDQWATLGVEGHFHGKHPWVPYHELFSEPLAHIVGAKPHEVVMMNTLTVNLHLMMVSFYKPTKSRFKILHMLPSFPSDRYALASQVSFHGYHPEEAIITLEPKAGESYVRLDELEEVLKKEGENITLVILDGMNYYSGQTFNMQRVTELGHNQGCLVGFDLAHAVGNIELSLHNWGVDFAVWCSYKYLNGGPGCVAGCFVHDKYANACDLPRFAGWWGNNKKTRFLMGPKFEPIYGAEGWQVSNPPIFSLAAFRSSLELFHEVGMQALRRKSILLTGYLEYLLNERCEDRVSIFTPRNPDQRGCQLSLSIARGGRAVFESLREIGVVCDWREPDVIRVAPVPFYNTFSEVYEFVDCLEKALE